VSTDNFIDNLNKYGYCEPYKFVHLGYFTYDMFTKMCELFGLFFDDIYHDIFQKIKGIYNNKNNDLCYLVYHVPDGVNYKELYPDFEIVKGNERPTKNGGWIYVINPQWIIYSPHKTEKKDNPVIKWLSNYIIFSVIAGIIFLIVKRVIKKGKQ
jgi:hypothetical protein